MGLFSWDIQSFFITLIVLFTSMPVHECAHAWAAHKLGDDTAYYQGRLDLNPFKHLDLVGSIMLLTTQRFGWAKPVPVNPRNFTRKISMRAGMALTSLAGPAANILMAFIIMLVYKLIALAMLTAGIHLGNAVAIITQILSVMVSINISLAVFNLLPIPPLDGYGIASYFIPPKWEYKFGQYRQYIYYGLLAILLFTELLTVPLSFLTSWVFRFLDFATGFIDVIARMIV
ncbi:site-2 protease family protein [Oscillospiraceae bacterium PP1C4]